jgi:hypothetical protein
MQQLSHHAMAGLMAKPAEFFGQFAHTLACPTQRRLGIATGDGINQTFQVCLQGGIFVDRLLAPPTGAAYPAHPHTWRLVQFLDPLNDRPPRYTSLTRDFRCSSKADRHALAGRDEPSHTLVEKRR